MAEAIRNYTSYKVQPDAWILGRFVCPASRLEELSAAADQPLASDFPFRIAAVSRGGATSPQFFDALRADLDAIRAFGDGAPTVVDGLEARLPPDICAAPEADIRQFLLRVNDLFRGREYSLYRYFEGSQGENWQESAKRVICVLSEFGREHAGNGHESSPGFKLRCGGLEPEAIPPIDDVALALVRCRGQRVPFKATAGLHQALRHFDADLHCPVHGFLNVFGAGALAHARRLTEPQVRLIVASEDSTDFIFDEEGFRFRDWHATSAEIALARKNLVLSFGSCSFDEPLEDLHNLGLLSR